MDRYILVRGPRGNPTITGRDFPPEDLYILDTLNCHHVVASYIQGRGEQRAAAQQRMTSQARKQLERLNTNHRQQQ